ncbi:MAG: sigma-70 family RNA polymerase sigma factor, partial [Muribaculaceae bacterium]|nr:sigma-70 family RNA polymerase sigma factor [Muribaculaceae bacterium]
DIPVEKISDTLKVSARHVSVDAPLSDDEEGSLLDVLPNNDAPEADSSLNKESLIQEINRALSRLSDRECDVVKRFFGIDCNEMSLDEISEALSLSRERVRQIKEKAIRQLKGENSAALKSFLGQ